MRARIFRHHVIRLLTVLLCATGAILPALAAESDLMTWKSTAGSTINAKLVRVDGETVVLQTAAGKRIRLKKTQLAPGSLAQLKKLTGEYAIKETETWLPVFADGPGKGSYARYQSRVYEALITRQGHVRIYFLDGGGKRVSNRYLGVRPGLGYTRKQEWMRREIASASAKEPPRLQPDKVVVEGSAADGVRWEFTFEFGEESISVWGMAKDPNGIEFPTVCQVVSTLPRYDGLDYLKPAEEVQGVVGESSLVIKKNRRKELHFNYVDRYELPKLANNRDNPSTGAIVRCNLFGDRAIHWEPNSLSKGRLLFWAAGTSALWDAYTIYFRNNDASANSRKSRVTLKFK